MRNDEEDLRLLSIIHYILSGLVFVCSLFPIIHLVFGLVLAIAPDVLGENESPPAFIGWLFAAFAGVIILVGLALAACLLASARFLGSQRHYLFCLVMAGVECLFMPLGTILGVFTIVVLMRESVQQLFEGKQYSSLGSP